MASQRVAEALRILFKGAEGVYGTYEIDKTSNGAGKVGGKALTIKKPVTQDLWDSHVDGKQSIGIVPIKDDNTCSWGCIDVDQYPAPIAPILKKIQAQHLPLQPCFSKSGGMHLFLFLEEPAPAKAVQIALRTMALSLGLSGCEIFPKQTNLDREKGEVGNWLNMPFFGDTRMAIGKDGKPVSASLFLRNITKILPSQLPNGKLVLNERQVPDGPPCLQAICNEGITADAHNRNNVLMAMATFYRKAFPDDWENRLTSFNGSFVKPPLPASEVDGIRKRMKDKDYGYQCSQDPIRGYCNRAVCVTRKYGVQSSGGEMVIDSVTQIKTSGDDYWLIKMNDMPQSLKMTTPDLMSQAKFAEQYFATFRTMPYRMKPEDWIKFLNSLGEQAVVVEDMGFGVDVRFRELLKKFVDKKQKPDKENTLRDGVWIDRGGAWFTALALAKFLEQQRFTVLSPGAMNHAIKEAGGEFKVLRVGNSTHRMIRLPLFAPDTPAPLPELDEEPI